MSLATRRAPAAVAAVIAAAASALACSNSESIVVVSIDADSGLASVRRLHAMLSNGGLGDDKTFPTKSSGATMVTLPTSFSLTLPHARAGALDIALDGLDAGGLPIAHGDGTVAIEQGDETSLTITLHDGPALCGNGNVEGDEVCDDGDRFSNGTCDFRCRARSPGPGTGGTTGAAGTTGAGGDGSAGTTGAGGTTGTGGTGGTGPCTVELLANGDFEAGGNGWSMVTSGRDLIYDFADVDASEVPDPQSASHLAWLGYDVLNETVYLRQQVQVPAGTQSLAATGYIQIRTNDDPSVVYDTAYIDVLVGAFTQPIDHWSNADANADWLPFTHTLDTTGVSAGTTATYQIRVQMDDGANTSFFFDSLSLVATRCAP